MKEINGEKFVSEEELKKKLIRFMEKDELCRKDPLISLVSATTVLSFISFVF